MSQNSRSGKRAAALLLVFFILSLSLAACGGKAKEYNDEGLKLFEAGDYAGAKEAFSHAVEENRRTTGYYTNLAMACLELGDTEGAASAYEKALSLNDKDPYVYRGLGIYYLQSGLYQQSIAAFSNAEQFGGRDKTFLLDVQEYKAEALLSAGDYSGAVSTYQKILEQDPRNATIQYLLGRALLAAGDTNGAVGAFGRLETLNVGDSSFYSEIWNSLKEKGLDEEAENIMQRVLSRQGTDESSVRMRSLAAFLLQDYERVVQELGSASLQDPELMEYLTISYAQTGRSVEALAMYDRLQATDPENSQIAERLAEYYLSAGDYENAMGLIHKAQEKLAAEKRRMVDYYEAVCYEYQHDYSTALQRFQTWRNNYGEDEKVNHEIAFLQTR